MKTEVTFSAADNTGAELVADVLASLGRLKAKGEPPRSMMTNLATAKKLGLDVSKGGEVYPGVFWFERPA